MLINKFNFNLENFFDYGASKIKYKNDKKVIFNGL